MWSPLKAAERSAFQMEAISLPAQVKATSTFTNSTLEKTPLKWSLSLTWDQYGACTGLTMTQASFLEDGTETSSYGSFSSTLTIQKMWTPKRDLQSRTSNSPQLQTNLNQSLSHLLLVLIKQLKWLLVAKKSKDTRQESTSLRFSCLMEEELCSQVLLKMTNPALFKSFASPLREFLKFRHTLFQSSD